MTIDTIFMCFCEDCDHNDGIEKPYFMSTGLMVSENLHNISRASNYRVTGETMIVLLPFLLQEFVENSSKALEAMKKRKYADKNQVEPVEKDAMGSSATIPDVA